MEHLTTTNKMLKKLMIAIVLLNTYFIGLYLFNTNKIRFSIDRLMNNFDLFNSVDQVKCNNFTISAKDGRNYTNFIDKTELSFEEIEQRLKTKSIELINGGKSFTKTDSVCSQFGLKYKRVAFIVPYRDRLANLKIFLNNMHVFCTRHNITYGMYLIEPNDKLAFNRGLLMNIGFVESMRDVSVWNCFVFHDVDLLPEDDRLFYSCNDNNPLHYAVAVSRFNYRTDEYFKYYYGGVNAFTAEQFENINGFSNLFFGWGGEDDDLYHRTIFKYGKIKKINAKIGRYLMLNHSSSEANPERYNVIADSREKRKEIGIWEGLSTLNYQVLETTKHYLFTKIIVSYNKTRILATSRIGALKQNNSMLKFTKRLKRRKGFGH